MYFNFNFNLWGVELGLVILLVHLILWGYCGLFLWSVYFNSKSISAFSISFLCLDINPESLLVYFFPTTISLSFSSHLSFSLSISPTEAGERGLGISAIARREPSQFRSGYECLAVDKGRKAIGEERGL